MNVVACDDSRAFLTLIERLLLAAGHGFRGVTSWPELAGAISKTQPNVVIIDGSAPILDGTQIVAIVRKHWPKLPILLTSGEPPGASDLNAKAAGASAYLTKIDVPKRLLSMLESLVRAAHVKGF